MEDLTHDELRITLKEIPDYAAYEEMPLWPLFDSVCLIIEEWPDRETRKHWSQTIEDRYNDVRMPMLSDIIAGSLAAKKIDNEYWLDKEDVIAWAKSKILPLHSLLSSIEKSLRELQLEKTVNKWKGIQDAANSIFIDEFNTSGRQLTKDQITARLQQDPRWAGINSGTIKNHIKASAKSLVEAKQ